MKAVPAGNRALYSCNLIVCCNILAVRSEAEDSEEKTETLTYFLRDYINMPQFSSWYPEFRHVSIKYTIIRTWKYSLTPSLDQFC
jgi:hypothetical protein